MTAPNLPIWSDGSSLGLPPLRGEVWADTVVVGLGGSGLAAVLELLARKKTVIGIEAGSVGSGAAGRNGGFLLAGLHDFHHQVVKAHGRGAADEIYRLTVAELERVATETPEAVRRTGSLRLASDDAEMQDCKAHFDALRQSGFPREWYKGAEGEGVLIPGDAVYFVRPEFRGRGIGKTLLAHLAALALERGCGRLEWSVLDWNADAIRFYESLDAKAMDEWTVYRVTGDALKTLSMSSRAERGI